MFIIYAEIKTNRLVGQQAADTGFFNIGDMRIYISFYRVLNNKTISGAGIERTDSPV